MEVPKRPYDFFERPSAFGRTGAKLRDDLGRERRTRDRAIAAMHQHRVVQTVDTLRRHQNLKQSVLAVATGISSRRLSRVLTGEAWVHLYDLVALGRVLGTDLVQVRVVEDLTFKEAWVPKQPERGEPTGSEGVRS